jgi:molecular chaperone DnaJ
MASRLPDLYDVLGVDRTATEDDIKRAYRRLARELHPDVNGDPVAEQRFKEITAAYDTLSDPVRRRQYDVYGRVGGSPAGGPGMGPDFPFADFGDIFDVFFGGGSRQGRRRGRRSRARAGEDLRVPLGVTFEQAAFGASMEIEIDNLVVCESCSGTGCVPGTVPARCASCGGQGDVQDVARSVFGTVMTTRPCPACQGAGEVVPDPCLACRGEGRVRRRAPVFVEIPPGVSDGMELRMPGSGCAGRAGGPAGDLYVSFDVAPHPVFERRGQDLICELSVPMTMAALGADVEILTLEGAEVLRLQAGTESGTVIRLRGKGIPNLERRGRGDLFVTILVETPEPRSKEERTLLERLAELRGEKVASGGRLSGRLRKLLK